MKPGTHSFKITMVAKEKTQGTASVLNAAAQWPPTCKGAETCEEHMDIQ